MSFTSTGVRKRNFDTDRLQSLLNSDEQGFIQRMKPFNAESPGRGLVESGQGGGSQPNLAADLFTTAGKAINGAIGYVQGTIEVAVGDTIDFFRDASEDIFSSYFKIINSGVGKVIDIFNGGDFPGQILKLQGDDTDTVTINNANNAGNTTSNIILPGTAATMTLGVEQLTEFVFDPLKTINGHTGAWRLASEDTTAGGGGATNQISQGDSSVTVTDTGIGQIDIVVDAINQGQWTVDGFTYGAVSNLFMDGRSLFFDDIAANDYRILWDGATSLDTRVPVSGSMRWFIAATQEMSLGATNLTLAGVNLAMNTNDINDVENIRVVRDDNTARMAILGGTAASTEVLIDMVTNVDLRFTEGLTDVFEISNSTNDIRFFRDLKSQGAANITMANNDVTGLNRITFNDAGGLIQGAVATPEMLFQLSGASTFRFATNLVDVLDIDDTGLIMKANMDIFLQTNEEIWFDGGTTIRITSDGSSLDFRTVTSPGNFRWFIGATNEMALGSTSLTLAGVNLQMDANDINDAENIRVVRDDNTARLAILGGSGSTTQVLFDAVTDVDIRFTEGLTDVFEIQNSTNTVVFHRPLTADATNIQMAANDINDVENLRFVRDDNTARLGILGGSGATTQVLFDAVTNVDIRFTEGLADRFEIQNSTNTIRAHVNMNLEGNDITNIGLVTASTVTATSVLNANGALFVLGNATLGDADSDTHAMSGYMEIEDMTAPANTADATSVRFFLDSATGELSVRKNTGSPVSLEAGGGSAPPFDDNQDIIQDNADNTKVWRMTLDPITTGATKTFSFVGGGTTTYTFQSTGGLVAHIDTAQNFTNLQSFASFAVTDATPTFVNGSIATNDISGTAMNLSSTQTATGTKTFNNIVVADATPSFVNGSINILDISGTAVNLSSTQTITGQKTFNGTVNLNGSITNIGNSTADDVHFLARVDTSFIPDNDNLFDLGAVGLEWRDLFIDGTANIDVLDTLSIDLNEGSLANCGTITRGGAIKLNLVGSDLVMFAPNDVILRVTGSGDLIQFSDGGDRIHYEFINDDFSPIDNVAGLGKSGRRWVDVWAVDGTINTSFTTFKENIVKLPDSDCMDVCKNLETIKFQWKPEMFRDMKPAQKAKHLGKTKIGFNADSLQTDLPEAVAGPDGIYSNAIIATLLGAVRHLEARIATLEGVT